MAARAGMIGLISELRGYLNDRDSSRWTDDELQGVLDRNRQSFRQVALAFVPRWENSTTVYKEYAIPRVGALRLEGPESGEPAWRLYDSNGVSPEAATYAVDAGEGLITFTADQEGVTYYLDYRLYDVYAAAADGWEDMMGQVSGKYSFTADGATYTRNQWFQHCQAMARQYREKAEGGQGTQIVNWDRSDTNAVEY
ncbi:MAG: hypothetical protein GX649_19055 [Chloroflexi bacterium]|nr:hypothetical protein [Chloroflexota bacterium]